MDSPHGRFLVGINIFGDLCVVPMMLLVAPLSGRGGGPRRAALALGKAAAAAVIVFFAARFLVPRVLRAVAAPGEGALSPRRAAAGPRDGAGTPRAGLSLAVGAFLAGLVVSDSDFGHQAMADIAPFRDAFNALFFVSVGMLFDARILAARPWSVARACGLVLVGKAVVRRVAAASPGVRPAGRRDRRDLPRPDRRVRLRAPEQGRSAAPGLPRRVPGRLARRSSRWRRRRSLPPRARRRRSRGGRRHPPLRAGRRRRPSRARGSRTRATS